MEVYRNDLSNKQGEPAKDLEMNGREKQIDLAVSDEQLAAVSRLAEAAKAMRSYIYPWATLESDFADREASQLPLLGYGSLVNRSSAALTLSGGSAVPAVAFGVRRLFNYLIPPGVTRYAPSDNPAEIAALNVVPTGRLEDMVNGVLIEIALEDVPALRSREVGYDLVPVACMLWDEREEPPFLGYILHTPDEPRDGKVRTASDIFPLPTYYEVCRDGAADIGESFLKFWLATTFMADGVTPITEWEKAASEPFA